MRKLILGAVVASLSLAVVAGATGQEPDASLNTNFSPTKGAGTATKPRNTKLDFQMWINKPNTTVELIDLQLPRGLKMSGTGFRRCPLETIGSDPSLCPSGSKAGPQGTASAVLHGFDTPLELTVQSYVVNSTTLGFRVDETLGLQVHAPLEGKITDQGRRLRITIPHAWRYVNGNNDLSFTELQQVFSGKRGSRYIVSSVGCHQQVRRFSARLTFGWRLDRAPVPAPLTIRDGQRCWK